MDYKKNINVFSFWKVRHVELRLKVEVCGSEDRAEMMPSLWWESNMFDFRIAHSGCCWSDFFYLHKL